MRCIHGKYAFGTLTLLPAVHSFVSSCSTVAFDSNRRCFKSRRTASMNASTESCVDRSTLTLLEHVNLNVPNHDYIIPFYIEVLGLGLDPRKAENVAAGSKTIWANCGASQFHLPFGETPQVIPGHIGLIYDDLQPLKDRVLAAASSNEKCFAYHEITSEHVKLKDNYGNVFVCRERELQVDPSLQQPLLSKADVEQFGDVATKYGVDGKTECRGISYVELDCPVGTAEIIADFYDCVLDATTSALQDGGHKVAIIGFGGVNSNGQAAQNLLFRETTRPIPPYDGHHLAMYVGESIEDFEQAFKNAEIAGVVWVNPRFSDKAQTLQGAREYKQFRFKDIVDMKTGEKVFELEHEMRSVEHKFWPGKK